MFHYKEPDKGEWRFSRDEIDRLKKKNTVTGMKRFPVFMSPDGDELQGELRETKLFVDTNRSTLINGRSFNEDYPEQDFPENRPTLLTEWLKERIPDKALFDLVRASYSQSPLGFFYLIACCECIDFSKFDYVDGKNEALSTKRHNIVINDNNEVEIHVHSSIRLRYAADHQLTRSFPYDMVLKMSTENGKPGFRFEQLTTDSLVIAAICSGQWDELDPEQWVQLEELNDQIKPIGSKAIDLQERGHTEAAEEAERLYQSLNRHKQTFLIDTVNLLEFTNACRQDIEAAQQGELKNHRDFFGKSLNYFLNFLNIISFGLIQPKPTDAIQKTGMLKKSLETFSSRPKAAIRVEWELTQMLGDIQLHYADVLAEKDEKSQKLKATIEHCQAVLTHSVFATEKFAALQKLNEEILRYRDRRLFKFTRLEKFRDALQNSQTLIEAWRISHLAIPMQKFFIEKQTLSPREITQKYGCVITNRKMPLDHSIDPSLLSMGNQPAAGDATLKGMSSLYPDPSSNSRSTIFKNKTADIKTFTTYSSESVTTQLTFLSSQDQKNTSSSHYFLFAMQEVEKLRDLTRSQGNNPDTRPVKLQGDIPQPIQDAVVLYCHARGYKCKRVDQNIESDIKLPSGMDQMDQFLKTRGLTPSVETYSEFILREININPQPTHVDAFFTAIQSKDKGEQGRCLNAWQDLENPTAKAIKNNIKGKFSEIVSHVTNESIDSDIKKQLENLSKALYYLSLDQILNPDGSLRQDLFKTLNDKNKDLTENQAILLLSGSLTTNILGPDGSDIMEIASSKNLSLETLGICLKEFYGNLNHMADGEHYRQTLVDEWIKQKRRKNPEFYALLDKVAQLDHPFKDEFLNILNSPGQDYAAKLKQFASHLESKMQPPIPDRYDLSVQYDMLCAKPPGSRLT